MSNMPVPPSISHANDVQLSTRIARNAGHPVPNSTVRGPIIAEYLALGGATGQLGKMLGNETKRGGGVEVPCSKGAIYWSAETGAHAVYGQMADAYQRHGGPTGSLGFPTSGIVDLRGDQLCRFEHGSLAWHRRIGGHVHEVHGDIAAAWEQSGGAKGLLGFPSSDETTHATGIRYNTFTGGIVIAKAGRGVRVVPKLRLHLGLVTCGDFGDFTDDTPELVTYHTVTVDGRTLAERKRSPSGHAETSHDIDVDYSIEPGVETKFVVKIEVDDWDRFSDNDRIGSWERVFDIGNGWGLFDGSPAGIFVNVPRSKGDRNLRFNLSVAPQVPFSEEPFRANLWWRSDNFTTPDLTLRQYADTFRDVELLSDVQDILMNPFDAAYYQLAYKNVAENGNCFGLSLEAIYARFGHSLLNEPLYQHVTTARDDEVSTSANVLPPIRNLVNFRQGYQLGASAIRWIVSRVAGGEATSPKRVYQRVKQALTRRDYPVLSMFDLRSFRGHAVMPYRCVDGDGTNANPHRIYVADPNVVWREEKGDPTFVAIFPDNTFEFVGGDPGKPYNRTAPPIAGLLAATWLVEFPYHVLCEQPRTPGWEVLLGLTDLLGGLLILGGDGETEQLSSDGKQFYRVANGQRTGLEKDGIPGLARMPFFDHGDNAPELFAQIGALPNMLAQSVRGMRAGTYRHLLASGSSIVSFETPVAAQARDRMHFDELRSGRPMLQLETSQAPKLGKVVFTAGGDEQRTFAADLQLAVGVAARIGFSSDPETLIVAPSGHARPLTITMRAGRGAVARTGSITVTPSEAGEVIQVRRPTGAR